MRRMGLRAIYQKPRTTVPGDPSERFPCLVDLTAWSRLIHKAGWSVGVYILLSSLTK